jgi:hypothetical protein
MLKLFIKTRCATLVAMTLVGAAVSVAAQDKKGGEAQPVVPTAPAKPAAVKGVPYGGTISAVDKPGMTLTVKKKEVEKTFTVTANTKIRKAGQPATFDDAMVGEEAGISYVESGGKAEALSLRLGPKPEKPEGKKGKQDADKAGAGMD